MLIKDHKRTETNLSRIKPTWNLFQSQKCGTSKSFLKITSSFLNFWIPVGLISWQRYQFQCGKSLLIFFTLFCIFSNSFSKDLCVGVTPQIKELTANSLAVFLAICCRCENLNMSRNNLMSSPIDFFLRHGSWETISPDGSYSCPTLSCSDIFAAIILEKKINEQHRSTTKQTPPLVVQFIL